MVKYVENVECKVSHTASAVADLEAGRRVMDQCPGHVRCNAARCTFNNDLDITFDEVQFFFALLPLQCWQHRQFVPE